MRRFRSLRKPLLETLAAVFAAATVLHIGLAIYSAYKSSPPPVELGYESDYDRARHCLLVTMVYRASPAEQAGLKARDCILAFNGESLKTGSTQVEIYYHSQPGDVVELTVKRPKVPSPILLRARFRAAPLPSRQRGATERLLGDVLYAYPLPFLMVGLAVLFLRLDDPNAWLLALMFAGFIAAPFPNELFFRLGPFLRAFARTYRAIFVSFLGALFYFFFAVFPMRSPLDRRGPWLKWAGLAFAACLAVPALGPGNSLLPSALVALVGLKAANIARLSYTYGFCVFGLIALVATHLASSTPAEARRKTRVILWGTLVGFAPILIGSAVMDIFLQHPPFILNVLLVLLLLFPLSFAYAVLKHRVLEIPVLLRRSARYLLVQRGFLFLHLFVSAGATVVFAWGLSRAHLLNPMGLTGGVLFGSVLALGGIRIHRAASERIDRAFFRNAYDARLILQDLADKLRTTTDRTELAARLGRHLEEALHPTSLAVYFESSRRQLSVALGSVPPELATISATEPLLISLARIGRPREVSTMRDAKGVSLLAPLQPDCLVPMLGRDGQLAGLIVLGARLSEGPYSREDLQLLASVASQAGVALEAIRLGEKIAERIDAERRAAQEMEFARQVQARLFPQKMPELQTLEYAGRCLQANQVGGDYYDFLELGPGRVALVLADIAGKGVSGALLMANLQANLRSQYALALDNLERLLTSVNRLFYENTADNSYATLFFGDYDDASRRLRYVNCGHLPPLLVRGRGNGGASSPSRSIERLTATSTVLGLFDGWRYEAAEVELRPDDVLVLYTDGVTEAANESGEEFGESRLAETLSAESCRSASSLLEAIIAAVQRFSHREQTDDITLIVARSRP